MEKNIITQKAISLEYFKKKVQERVVRDFLNKVKKPHLNSKNYNLIPMALLLPLGVGLYSIVFIMEHPPLFLAILSCLLGIFFGLLGALALHNLIKYSRAFFNFKKESDKYFETVMTKLPLLENNKDIHKYIAEKNEIFFCNQSLSEEEIKNLFSFTADEIEEFKTIDLNETQKHYLYFTIEKNKDFNFKDLEDLVAIEKESKANHWLDKLGLNEKTLKYKFKNLL